jgi:putative oxidoreductase
MLKLLVQTKADYVPALARLVLGFLFFVHGSQLMLGWFGGSGLSGSMQFFTQQLGIPVLFAFLAICTQFFGGLLLIVGFVGRIDAFAIICTMVVAVAKVHWHFGLFMNWFGTQKGEGFEYHLLAITLGLIVVLRGSGSLSLDRSLVRWSGNVPVETDSEGSIHAGTSAVRF